MATTGFGYALRATARRTREAFRDPIRRLHLSVQFVVLVPSAAETGLQAAVGWHIPTWRDLLACVAAGGAYYAVYEYLLEPWSKRRVRQGKPSLVGPYVERGPQDGERFTYE